jgi:hypothetical protein
VVVKGTTQLRPAQDHLLISKGLPCDLVAIAQHVALPDRGVYVFSPKRGYFATRQVRGPQNEGDVQLAFADERDLLDQCALKDMHQHVGMARAIGSYDLAKKAG